MSKRLGWSPETTLMMEEDRRDSIFTQEKAILDAETRSGNATTN